MPQTSYLDTYVAGKEGAIADNSAMNAISRSVETVAGILPGRVVTKGTAVGQIDLPNAAADISTGVLEGIVVWVPGREPGGAAGEFIATETAAVLRKGVIWMLAEDVVAYGGAVYVHHVGAALLGRVRSDADGGDATLLPTGRFLGTTTGVNQLVKVEINLP